MVMPDTMSPFATTIMQQKYSHDIEGRKETWPEIAKRTAWNVMKSVNAPLGLIREVEKAIVERKFIPGGRYLAAAGRPFHQTQNCLILKAEDSREGWADLLQKSTMALMTGAGIGVVYSELRSEGKRVRKTGGIATGPLALMQIENELGRGVRQGGDRRCLPTGTLVHTNRGLVEIEQVDVGDFVKTRDGYRRVIARQNQGVQKTIKVQTQCGVLECTPNHRVAVVKGLRGECIWKEAGSLTNEDRLFFVDAPTDFAVTASFPSYAPKTPEMSFTHNLVAIPSVDEGIAWFLGYFHGNGNVYLKNDNESGTKRHGKVGVSCPNNRPEVLAKVVEQFGRFGGVPLVRQGDGEVKVVVCYGVQFGEFFGLLKTANTTIEVPSFIKRASPSIRAAYLAGVMDADGCDQTRPVLVAVSVYPEFLEELQALWASLGVATRLKRARLSKGNWKSLYHLSVCGGKHLLKLKGVLGPHGHKVGFDVPEGPQQCSYSLPRRMMTGNNEKANISIEAIEREIGPQLFTPVLVKGVEEGEEQETWDLQVEGVEEFVVGAGYLVHNSAIWAGLHWNHPDVHKFIHMKDWIPEVRAMKEKDFSFPATMDGTNVSVILDDAFFKAYHNEKDKAHSLAQGVYRAVVRQALRKGEPGISVNCGEDNDEVGRNACGEATSRDDSDVCNLGSINLGRVESLEEMRGLVRMATSFLLAGTVYSDVPYPKVDQVRTKNRRLGLGLMGIHEWLLMHGKKYGADSELEEYLKIYANSGEFANEFADLWELSRPVKTRAIAPTGTTGLVTETTTGIEPIYCVAMKRRYLKGNSYNFQYIVDPTAQKLIDKGVNPDLIEDAYTLAENPERRVAFQAWVQKYVDHAISSTINLPAWGTEFNNEERVIEFGDMLMKHLPQLRGITCYPDGARSGQPLQSVRYATAIKHIGEVFVEGVDVCDLTKAGSCG